MKNLKIITILLIALIFSVACSDDYLIEEPKTIISADNLYQNYSGFQYGLNGVYAMIRLEKSGRSTGYHGGSNEMMSSLLYGGTDLSFANYYANNQRVANSWGSTLDPTNPLVETNWTWLYSVLNSINTIITRSENTSLDLKDNEKQAIQAEAKCLRAWVYRHLVNMWGEVPLNLEESLGSTIKTDWERASKETIYKQMEEDLLFAEQYLPGENQPGKLVNAVATHYLAELYLLMNQPEKAKQKAEAVINSGRYELIESRYGVKANQPGTPFSDMFLDGNSNKHEGNTEALWVWQNESRDENLSYVKIILRRTFMSKYETIKINGINPLKLTVERGGRGQARLSATKYMLGLYEPQDLRGSEFSWRWFFTLEEGDKIPDGYALGDTIWLNAHETNTEKESILEWPYTRKWDYGAETNIKRAGQYNDIIYLRLAETYLLLAEAQLALGDNSGAAQTINVIRRRAGASEIGAGDVNIDFLLDERARELFSEEHRRYTLLRTGKWIEKTKLYNPLAGLNITERDKLFPIPQSVIDANIDLEMPQNEGY